MKSFKASSQMGIPEDFTLLGTYEGFQLFHKFVSEAKYSDRSIAYICAKKAASETVAFTQAASIHRRAVGERSEQDVERRLTIDALSRAKHRIADGSYVVGEAYTIELEELDME